MTLSAPASAPVAVALADGLASAGVRRIFGMPGGGPNLEMIGAAADRGIDFVLAHGETAACVMAGTFGLLTGTAGVAVVTRGPGLTSAANGLAQATLDGAPLVLLSDRVPEAQRERTGHQRLDQLAVSRPLTRWSGTLGHADPAAVAAASVRVATGPPAGAVHLDFDPGVPGDRPPAPAGRPTPAPAGSAEAARLARGSCRPVVVLGAGAVRHAAAVRAVLAGAGVPVLTTYQALGTVEATAGYAAGLFTNAALERPLLESADLVIGVGLDGVEPMPGPWDYPAPVVLLSDTEVDGTYFGEPCVVPGPPAAALAELLAATASSWPAGAGEAHRRSYLRALDAFDRGEGMHPLELAAAVRESVGDTQLTVDAGAHMLAVMPLWPAVRPHQVLISNGLATMGYALPSAIGAALARPGERVVCLTGDGGLGMVLAELETVARLGLPVTVVVFDDAALSLIELKQRAGHGGPAAVRYAPVDFAGVAAAMGIPATTAGDEATVRAALAGAPDGPFLIDARIDPAGYRHVIRTSRG